MSSIIRRRDVERLVGLSYSSIYRRERSGTFPQRVRLGENSVGWRESEVLAWCEARERVECPQ